MVARFSCLLPVGLACVLLSPLPAFALRLAEGGASDFVIAIDGSATPTDRLAARELQEHFQLATGVALPVRTNAVGVVHAIELGTARARGMIGDGACAVLDDEECICLVTNGTVAIVGAGAVGTAYGVYSFLEREFGCLWLTVAGDRFVPRRDVVDIREGVWRDRPRLAYRDVLCFGDRWKKDSSDWLFLFRNRINQIRGNFENPVRPDLAGALVPRMRELSPACHSLFFYMPPEEHFGSHPEYYSLETNGVRRARQLCFSNRGLRDALKRRFLAHAASVGGKGFLDLSAQDSGEAFCFCDDCRELVRRYGSVGGPLFDFLLELAPVAKARFPELVVHTLVYRKDQTQRPPKGERRWPDNLAAVFAPIDDDFSKPLTHANNAVTLADFRRWDEKVRTWLWYYPLPYGGFTPFGGLERTALDTRTAMDAGLDGAYYEHDVGVRQGVNFADLQMWMLLKHFQNPATDWRILRQMFCEAYYGAAADAVVAYEEALEECRRRAVAPHAWHLPLGAAFTPENLIIWNGFLDDAEAAVCSDPALLQRVREVRFGLDVETLKAYRSLVGAGKRVPSAEAVRDRATETLRQALARRYDWSETAERERKAHATSPQSWIDAAYSRALVDPRPLPRPFDVLKAEDVREILPVRAAGALERVADDEAALGWAVREKKVPEMAQSLPYPVGFRDWDDAGRILVRRRIPEEEILPGRFKFYRVGRTPIPSANCSFWIGESYDLTFSAQQAFRPGSSDEWDLYLSLKFAGPAFDCGARTGMSSVLFDRAIFVRAGALPPPSAVDLAFAGTDPGYRLPPGVASVPPQPQGRLQAMAGTIPPLPEVPEGRYGLEDGYGLTGRLETAKASLARCLGGKVPLVLRRGSVAGTESYRVDQKADGGLVLTADDDEGMRRAVYAFLKDAAAGTFRLGVRRPWLKDRISRCFFAPICRPPVHRDELSDDVERYGDAYLERLAYEGVNGLWITASLRDLAETSFAARKPGALRKLAKLRKIVAQCARYGIGVWLFAIEPSLLSPDDPVFASHPELACERMNLGVVPCPSNPAMNRFVRETVRSVFAEVPGLAGMIDITYGEWPTSCLEFLKPRSDGKLRSTCPRCRDLEPWQIHARSVTAIRDGLREASPTARLFSWFYYPDVRDGESWVADVVRHEPEGVVFQFNFESGAEAVQLGKLRRGGDYWLSFPGPGRPFSVVAVAARAANVPLAVKTQTGCSHELATLPYVPVPGLLYRKFRAMRREGVSSAMLNWYFGNAPGLMQEAAGELAFCDFTEGERGFLVRLAKPQWGSEAEAIADCWERLGEAYARYPLDNAVQYYGPFHAGVAWPLLPDVALAPLARSWSAGEPPSGDAIGECLGSFTLADLASIAKAMADDVERIVPQQRVPASGMSRGCLLEKNVVDAFALQLVAASDALEFYRLRAGAVAFSRGRGDIRRACAAVDAMRRIVAREKDVTERMTSLSEADPRLGYHAEAESFLYHPELLRWRQAELVRAEKRLAEISDELSAGRPYPCSEFERRSPAAVIGGERVEISGGWFRVTENADGTLSVEGVCADEKEVLVNVMDAAGTAPSRAQKVTVADGRFRAEIGTASWLLLRRGSGGRFLWPAGMSRVRYRMCLDPVEGDFYGRLVR